QPTGLQFGGRILGAQVAMRGDGGVQLVNVRVHFRKLGGDVLEGGVVHDDVPRDGQVQVVEGVEELGELGGVLVGNELEGRNSGLGDGLVGVGVAAEAGQLAV